MGRPGCSQCCDEKTPETCVITPDTVYIGSNNQEMGISKSDIKDAVRLSSDERPEEPPEDYNEYVWNEQILDLLYDSNFLISNEEQTPQRIISTVDKDNTYSFSTTVSPPYKFPEVKRIEVKGDNREFFFRYRDLEIEDEEDTYRRQFLTMEFLDFEAELEANLIEGTLLTFPTFNFDFSPDIINIQYPRNDTDTTGLRDTYSFNLKEEFGDYIDEESLKHVDFTAILDPEHFADLISDLDPVPVSEIDTSSEFQKIQVYKKDLTGKLTFLVMKKIPVVSAASYRDHRLIGGNMFFANIKKDFIDTINEMRKQSNIRGSISLKFRQALDQRVDWEVIDSGSPDAATKTILVTDLVDFIRDHVQESITSDGNFEAIAYIGMPDQQRDDSGYRVRKYNKTIPQSEYSEILEDILTDETFLSDIIGEITEDKIDEIMSHVIPDDLSELSYKIEQDDASADVTLHPELLSSASLPKPDSYTYHNLVVKVTPGDNRPEEEEDLYNIAMPRIGDGPDNGLTSSLQGFVGYRQKYYISFKYTNPNGKAFLNDVNSKLIISGSEDKYGFDFNGEYVIGKQIFVSPFCGSISGLADLDLRVPLSYIGEIDPNDLHSSPNSNRDIRIHYEAEDSAPHPNAIFDTESFRDVVSYTCLSDSASNYTKITDTGVAFSDFGSNVSIGQNRTRDIYTQDAQGWSTYILVSANADNENWKYLQKYNIYEKDEDIEDRWRESTVIEETKDRTFEGSKERFLELINQFKDEKFTSGNVTLGVSLTGLRFGDDEYDIDPSLSYMIAHTRYDKFKHGNNTVKTHEYISQWPSKKYLTIDMEPNTQDLGVAINRRRNDFQRFDTLVNRTASRRYNPSRNTSNFAGFVTSADDSVTYYKGKLLIGYTFGFGTDFYPSGRSVFIADDLYACNGNVQNKALRKDRVIRDSFTDTHTIEDWVDGTLFNQERLNNIIPKYEKNIALVTVVNTEKQFTCLSSSSFTTGAPAMSWFVGENFDSKKFTYKELLTNNDKEFENNEAGWSCYDGEDFLTKDLIGFQIRLTSGDGTESTNIVDCLNNFWYQVPVTVFDSEGYFMDAYPDNGAADQAIRYNTGEITPGSKWKNICLYPDRGPYGCDSFCAHPSDSYECTECTTNDTLTYNLDYNHLEDYKKLEVGGFFGHSNLPNHTHLPVGIPGTFVSISNSSDDGRGTNYCTNYTFDNHYKAFRAGNGNRVWLETPLSQQQADDFYRGNPNDLTEPRSSVGLANYSGEFNESYSRAPECRSQIGRFTWGAEFGGGPMFLPSSFRKDSDSPGYHVYANVVNSDDWYYHDYRYLVADTIKIRSYNLYTLPPRDSGIFLWPEIMWAMYAHPECLYGIDFLLLDLESWTEYKGWTTPGCSNDYHNTLCSFLSAEGVDCVPAFYSTSFSVNSYNTAYGYNSVWLVEDQSYSIGLDIRDHEQKIKEVSPIVIPEKNYSIEFTNPREFTPLDLNKLAINWGQ